MFVTCEFERRKTNKQKFMVRNYLKMDCRSPCKQSLLCFVRYRMYNIFIDSLKCSYIYIYVYIFLLENKGRHPFCYEI